MGWAKNGKESEWLPVTLEVSQQSELSPVCLFCCLYDIGKIIWNDEDRAAMKFILSEIWCLYSRTFEHKYSWGVKKANSVSTWADVQIIPFLLTRIHGLGCTFELCGQAWSLVWRIARCMMVCRKGLPLLTYDDKLMELKLPSLKARHTRRDMIQVWKYIYKAKI